MYPCVYIHMYVMAANCALCECGLVNSVRYDYRLCAVV